MRVSVIAGSRFFSSKSAVKFREKAFYTVPTVPVYFLVGPLAVINGVYAKHFGLSLEVIATVLLICRLLDAVSDPIIGFYTDRFYLRFGSRKPIVIAGGLLLVVSSYLLYSPIVDPVTPGYFLVCFFLWFFSFTLFEIPQLSWGADMVDGAHERTALYAMRTVGVNIGLLLFYMVPFLPFFEERIYTPEVLGWGVVIGGLLMLPSLWGCYRFTPDRRKDGVYNEKNSVNRVGGGLLLYQEVFENKALLVFVFSLLFFGVGVGVWSSLQYIYIDAYLGMGNYFSSANIFGLVVSSIIIGFIIKRTSKNRKKSVWMLGCIIYLLGILTASLLKPGKVDYPILLTVFLFHYVAISIAWTMMASIMSDIVDYSTWKFGVDRGATYFAFQTFSIKNYCCFW